MKHMRRNKILLSLLLFFFLGSLYADVKREEKTQLKFGGFMGKVIGVFGGKAAKEGLVSTAAVKGNRQMTVNEYTGQIIDLDEEKVYDLDMRKKTYQVTTFAELRRQMEEAQKEAQKQAKESAEEEQPSGKEFEIDFELKKTGQKKTINAYDCEEALLTITVREKGKTLEEGGGLVWTSNMWLTAEIPGSKEVEDFQRRYAEKLQGPFAGQMSAREMAMVMALYPGLKEAMGKVEAEKIEGTAILTVTKVESVATKEQMAQQKKEQSEEEPSLGGLLGGFGKKLGKKKESKEGEAPSDPNRKSIFTANHEVLKISTDVSAADISIPAGFKEKK